MRIICLAFLLLFMHKGYSQQAAAEKEAVLSTVLRFFEALEKKDTVLYKSLVDDRGQVWAANRTADSVRIGMRDFVTDYRRLAAQKVLIEEKEISHEIRIGDGIATVWMPYTLDIDRKRYHCGIDVFTLLQVKGTWKIFSCIYTADPNGCDRLMQHSSKKR